MDTKSVTKGSLTKPSANYGSSAIKRQETFSDRYTRKGTERGHGTQRGHLELAEEPFPLLADFEVNSDSDSHPVRVFLRCSIVAYVLHVKRTPKEF